MAKMATVTASADGSLTERIKSWPQRIRNFYTDVRVEMKKVTTPTRKEVQATTVVVIITVFLFGAYFGVIDYIIGHSVDKLMRALIHR
jgi:preprotein translocase subunit SecE